MSGASLSDPTTGETGSRLRTLRGLFDLSRPEQVALVLLVYLMGVLAAASGELPGVDAPFVWGPVLAGAVALVPLTVGVHYANEWADYETDLLTTPTEFSGGSGVFRRTTLPRRLALRGAYGAVTVGALLTIELLAVGLLSPTSASLLALITVLGWQYSLPPLELVRHGVGEVDNALLGGVLLPVYGASVVTGRLVPAVALASVPFALLVFANLLQTHWPDRHADRQVGKRTLVTRASAGRLRRAYWLVVAAAFGSLLGLHLGPVPTAVSVAGGLALPLSLWGGVTYTRQRSPFPAVAAMVTVAAAQTLAWGALTVW